jgi:hypothetical protein
MIGDAPERARPYANLSFRDRLELLAFEARLAGLPESLIQAVWEVIDRQPGLSFCPSPDDALRLTGRRSGQS